MNFSFTSGNFPGLSHLNKFNHQNENPQFFSNDHQLRYTNQSMINPQTTSTPTTQSGKFNL